VNDNLLPPVGASGVFTVKTPLDTIIKNDIEYKVTSIRTITDMIADEIDVKQYVYSDQSLIASEYENDLDNNELIVTLQAPDGSYYYIPANKFISIPDVTGVRFSQSTIAINLGFIPEDLDVSYMFNDIADLVKSMFGVLPSVEEIKTSQTVFYTDDEMTTFNQTRETAITNNETCISKLIKINDVLTQMKNKEKILVERLENLGG